MRLLKVALVLVGVLSGPAVHAAPIELLLESDVDAPAGGEVFLAGFASRAALIAGVASAVDPSLLDIGGSFSVAGLAVVGGAYLTLLESDADATGGSEVFLAEFASRAALLAGVAGSVVPSLLDIGSTFSIAGFDIVGDAYHLLLESDADAPGGSEIFVAEFASRAALIAGVAGAVDASLLDIGSSFSVAGFDIDEPAGTPVPEPSALILVGSALIGAAMRRHWRRRS